MATRCLFLKTWKLQQRGRWLDGNGGHVISRTKKETPGSFRNADGKPENSKSTGRQMRFRALDRNDMKPLPVAIIMCSLLKFSFQKIGEDSNILACLSTHQKQFIQRFDTKKPDSSLRPIASVEHAPQNQAIVDNKPCRFRLPTVTQTIQLCAIHISIQPSIATFVTL